MVDAKLIEVLFPRLAAVRVEEVAREGDVVCVRARTNATAGRCPECGGVATRVHDRYERRIADVAAGGQRVLIRLLVRRFVCAAADCTRRTFVEQVAGLTFRHGRVTTLLRGVLAVIAAALAGRPGARLAARTAITTSRSTLLRLLRATPVPQVTAGPRVLGVDDFAIRRGATYATILLDMDTRRPIDVLEGRTSETFAAWLRAHPGVEVICRDRGGNYADGARAGAPNAVQVADRYHLWANLGQAVDKTVIAHRGCLPEPVGDADETSESTFTAANEIAADELDPTLDNRGQPYRIATRIREHHAAVHGLLHEGRSLNAVSRELGLCFRTVQRYAQAASPDDLLATALSRTSEILTRCPELEAVRRHVAAFALMIRDLNGTHLDTWMTAVEADDLPALHHLVKGFRRDLDAVTNGLTLAYNSGACEGAVNRIKALKRAMFGRANLDLLRLRILLPN